MSTYSTNQARQLYVAKEYKTQIAPADAAGSIAVKSDKDKKHLYFQYKGAGGQTRSDLIDIKNILDAKATKYDKLGVKLSKYKVALDATLNGGAPIAGQDYILKILFRQYIGLSEENQTIKLGMVHAGPSMTASDFYKKLAISVAQGMSREPWPLVTVSVAVGDVETIVTSTTKESTLTGTYTNIVITEALQDWRLGTFAQERVFFNLLPDQVKSNGEEFTWGVVSSLVGAIVDNGRSMADLEYFCMGERGDSYRMIGWPNFIPTTYFVDPTLKYNTIDIHYAYTGSNESVQMSEKQITLVVPSIGVAAEEIKLTNSIITAINAATGLTIAAIA